MMRSSAVMRQATAVQPLGSLENSGSVAGRRGGQVSSCPKRRHIARRRDEGRTGPEVVVRLEEGLGQRHLVLALGVLGNRREPVVQRLAGVLGDGRACSSKRKAQVESGGADRGGHCQPSQEPSCWKERTTHHRARHRLQRRPAASCRSHPPRPPARAAAQTRPSPWSARRRRPAAGGRGSSRAHPPSLERGVREGGGGRGSAGHFTWRETEAEEWRRGGRATRPSRRRRLRRPEGRLTIHDGGALEEGPALQQYSHAAR